MTEEWYLRLAVLITRQNIRGFARSMEFNDEYVRHRAWLRLLGLMETWAIRK